MAIFHKEPSPLPKPFLAEKAGLLYSSVSCEWGGRVPQFICHLIYGGSQKAFTLRVSINLQESIGIYKVPYVHM